MIGGLLMSVIYTQLGFGRIDSQEKLSRLLARIIRKGDRLACENGSYQVFEAGDGAQAWGWLRTGDGRLDELQGFETHFSGSCRWTVSLLDYQDNPQLESFRAQGWVLPKSRLDEEYLNKNLMLMDLVNINQFPDLPLPGEVEIQPAAYLFKTEDMPAAFFADMSDYIENGPRLENHAQKANSPLPIGSLTPLLPPEGVVAQSAAAHLVGKVLDCSKCRNRFGKSDFFRAKVETIYGDVDVLWSREELDAEPKVGGVLWGAALWSARVLNVLG